MFLVSVGVSQVVLVVKNPPANAGELRDAGSIPGSGKSPGEGHGNPLQCSCLENPMDRGAWWAAVCGAAQSWTQLKWFNTHSHCGENNEFLLMCLLATHISSLVKCVFGTSDKLAIRLLVFSFYCWVFKSYSYILYTTLCQKYNLQIFILSLWLAFEFS